MYTLHVLWLSASEDFHPSSRWGGVLAAERLLLSTWGGGDRWPLWGTQVDRATGSRIYDLLKGSSIPERGFRNSTIHISGCGFVLLDRKTVWFNSIVFLHADELSSDCNFRNQFKFRRNTVKLICTRRIYNDYDSSWVPALPTYNVVKTVLRSNVFRHDIEWPSQYKSKFLLI